MPVVTFPPPWESGCGAADPALSAHFGNYTGAGYATKQQGEVGTINAGANTPVTAGPPPAQTRTYVQGNQLIILDNTTGNAYAVPLATALPQPPIYGPTK